MNLTQRLILGLSFVISVIFLVVAFRGLDPAAVWASIQEADPVPLVIGAVAYFAAVTAISQRWGFLLRGVRFVPLRRLVPLVSIGYMGNNVYPFRSGELLRVWLLQRNHGVPFARGITTAAVERVFDGLVMLTFIVVALLVTDSPSPEVRQVATVAAPIFVIGLSVFFVLAARPNWLKALTTLVSRILPGRLGELVDKLSDDLIAGLVGLRTPLHLAGTVFFSYLSWALEAGVYYIVAFAFDMNVTYADMLLVMAVVNLAGLIPAAPGNYGVFEFFASRVLIAAGVAEATALAYAFVVHVVIWLPVTLVGFGFLVREGLGWAAITRARDIEQAHDLAGDIEKPERETA